MLFGKKRKRDLRIFKIPENEPTGTKIPLRLLIGLLTPFILVTVFLLIFSRKIDLTTSVLKPGLPQAPQALHVPEVPVVSPEPVGSVSPVPEEPIRPPVPIPIIPKPTPPAKNTITPSLPAPKVVESEILPPSVKTPEKIVKPSVAVKKPVKPPIVGAVGKFTIQVGSFLKKEDADQVALRLNEHGHSAYVVAADIVDKGTWYRVRVGKYQDRPSAVSAGEKLAQSEQVAGVAPLSFIITTDTSDTPPNNP